MGCDTRLCAGQREERLLAPRGKLWGDHFHQCPIGLLPRETVEGEGGQRGNNRSFPGLEGSTDGPRAQPQGHVQTVRCNTIGYSRTDRKNHDVISPRLLKAGRAEVYLSPPPAHTSITHVMAKPITDDANSHNAPCYPVSHIVQHLFGVSPIKPIRKIEDLTPVSPTSVTFDHSHFNIILHFHV